MGFSSFLAVSLLIYRKATDFCVVTLCLVTLLEFKTSPVSSLGPCKYRLKSASVSNRSLPFPSVSFLFISLMIEL